MLSSNRIIQRKQALKGFSKEAKSSTLLMVTTATSQNFLRKERTLKYANLCEIDSVWDVDISIKIELALTNSFVIAGLPSIDVITRK